MTHSDIVAALKNDIETHPDVYADRQALKDRLAGGYDWRTGATILAERAVEKALGMEDHEAPRAVPAPSRPPVPRLIPGTPKIA